MRKARLAAVALGVLIAALPQGAGPAHAASAGTSVLHSGAVRAKAMSRGGEVALRPAAAAPRGAARSGAAPANIRGNFLTLQLNLCNGGGAGCYQQGRSVPEGGAMIRFSKPDLVTLNEICFADVDGQLSNAMLAAWPNDITYYVFMPAIDRATGGAYHCTNGDDFGNALLVHVPFDQDYGLSPSGWVYGNQRSDSNELRTAACAYVVNHYFACATHLANANEPIALLQCRGLMTSVFPQMKANEGTDGPTLAGGDLNLDYDTSDPENVQLCVPSGYTRKGDGSVQHFIFSNSIGFRGTYVLPMTWTDHNAFHVELTMP